MACLDEPAPSLRAVIAWEIITINGGWRILPVRFALGFLPIRGDRLIDLDSESDLDLDLDLYSDVRRESSQYTSIHDVYGERGTAATFITKNRTPEKARSFQGSKLSIDVSEMCVSSKNVFSICASLVHIMEIKN